MENIKRMIADLNEAIDMFDEIYELAKMHNYDLEDKYNPIDLKKFINISRICRAEFTYNPTSHFYHKDNSKLLNRYCEDINKDIKNTKDTLEFLLNDRLYTFYDNGTWYHKCNIKELLIDTLKSWDYIYKLQELYEN